MKHFLPALLGLALLGAAARAGTDSLIDEPLSVIRVYAGEGDPSAQFRLGLLYMSGEGVKQDAAEAAAWMRKAAAAGYGDAECDLGVLLSTGNGLPASQTEALKMFHSSALHGCFEAQRTLLLMSARSATPQGLAQALKWDFLARRTLELRYQAKPGLPPKPPVLQADGSATFVNSEGKHQIIDRSGQIRDAASGAPADPSPYTNYIPDGPLVPIQPQPPRLYRQQADIERQMASLEQAERETRYFLGATNADWEAARDEARNFLLELGSPPQRKDKGPPPAAEMAPPPPVPLRPLTSNRGDAYPFGLWGRDAIKELPWQHAETDHFIVHYADKSAANTAMRYIECAYFVVTETLHLDPHVAPRKIHVFIFNDVPTWQKFKTQEGLPPLVSGMAYKDELLLVALPEKDTYIKTLCHEATHAIVNHFYLGDHIPLWLNEGFAEYMAAKSMAMRRGQKTARYLHEHAPAEIAIAEVFDRVHYGTPGARAIGEGGAVVDTNLDIFYAQSEKCIGALLEKLPAGEFPRFMNLCMAGNPVPVALHAAYGAACPTAEAFQALVNAK